LELQGVIHVALDFSNAQRSVVNSDLVYSLRKILAVNAVPADLQRIRRGRDGTRLRPAGHLHAIYIQPHRRPVIGRRQMRPRIDCQRPGSVSGEGANVPPIAGRLELFEVPSR
jgi:hypothetical protein